VKKTASHFADFLSEAELAKQLKLTTRTLQIWRARGEGPAFARVGRKRIVYRIAAVRDWLESQEKRAA